MCDEIVWNCKQEFALVGSKNGTGFLSRVRNSVTGADGCGIIFRNDLTLYVCTFVPISRWFDREDVAGVTGSTSSCALKVVMDVRYGVCPPLLLGGIRIRRGGLHAS